MTIKSVSTRTHRINGSHNKRTFASRRSRALGGLLKKARIKKGITITSLSQKAKVTKNYIRYLENGKVLNVYFLIKYLNTLNMNIFDFVAGKHE